MQRFWRITPMLAASLLASCDPVSVPDAQTVDVRVEGEAGTLVEAVVSQEFAMASDSDADGPAVILIRADTTTFELPYQQSFDIRESRQFFLRLVGTEPEGRDVALSVWVDGDLEQQVNGWPPGMAHIEFVYLGGR